MSKKIFVGGLAWATVDAGLKAAFEPFGTVVDAKVIMDRETGRSRGFGFVTFSSEEEAQSACDAMNGQEIDGRSVRINIAEDTQRKPAGNRGGFNHSNREGRPNREPREHREPRENRDYREPREYRDNSEQLAPRRDDFRREEPSRSFVNDFAYMPDDSSSKRDSRRKDRRKDRDRYEDDDDRW